MGREVRMVPPNWDSPKITSPRFVRGQGLQDVERYQPMFDEHYDTARREWLDNLAKWEAGERPDYFDAAEYPNGIDYWEWEGGPPDRNFYRPWKDEEATWFQVWETVSEGTPVTPAFSTREELAEYLAANGDYWDQSRGDGPWDKAAAYKFVSVGWAPSGIISVAGVASSKDVFKAEGGAL